VWGHWADFDVPAALQWIEPRDQQTLHRLFGPGLCPIGETGGGSLWISEKSEVIGEYLIYDTATRSRSVEEAFEALFTCRNPAYETHVLHDDGARVEVSIAPWARGEETSASKP
jgi:hypothetical protein